MEALQQPRFTKRYEAVAEKKAGGATYTPKLLADFVAHQIVNISGMCPTDRPLRILDPAIGHGELLIRLLEHLEEKFLTNVEVYGFETDPKALQTATERLKDQFPSAPIFFEQKSFLEFVLKNCGLDDRGSLSRRSVPESYDLIIANPPYVRTQIMGAVQAQLLSKRFALAGRVDLYHAFILGISQVLKPKGIAGIIVSNRFMTTRSGSSIRKALLEGFNIHHAWDLGDTKLFDAAVLPAVLLVQGKYGPKPKVPAFTSIYQTTDPTNESATDPIAALEHEGVVEIKDGRHFHVQHGRLDTSGKSDGVWRVSNDHADSWLSTVDAHSWGTFRDIGKIRVGVKTCADRIFIRNDWQDIDQPELLKPLTTHHIARRYRALAVNQPSQILYPHEVVDGHRRAVDLISYPHSQAYLESHRPTLERRRYVIEAGREWYEIWVPQDPSAWRQPKLVFRDIAAEPTFWMDLDGSVVNGDCYWLVCQDQEQTDLLWLASAVGNSTFIERFYDLRFNNKLYAGRRRFVTQYVEQFPLPDPQNRLGKSIIALAKRVYEKIPSCETKQLQDKLNMLVWDALTGGKPT